MMMTRIRSTNVAGLIYPSDPSELEHQVRVFVDSANRIDFDTSRAIEALRPESIDHRCAYGCIPLSGLLTVAKKYSLRAETLDLRNSGDTAGPRDRVVGYGAYAFH